MKTGRKWTEGKKRSKPEKLETHGWKENKLERSDICVVLSKSIRVKIYIYLNK